MEERKNHNTHKYLSNLQEEEGSRNIREYSNELEEKGVSKNDTISSKIFQKKKLNWWKKCLVLWETADMVEKEKSVNAEMRSIFRELVVYIFFLTVVLISAFGLKSESRYYYTKVMEDLFINTETPSEKTFEELTIIADFWMFAETVLIDGLFWEYWYRTKDERKKTGQDDRKILYENKLLGFPRIRQVKVRPNSCTIPEHFRRIFATCYASYSSHAEDKTPFGPAIGTAWNYSPEEKVAAIRYWGKLATYSGGGYYTDLPVSTKDDMKLALKILKDNMWIRRGTRAVFIDFTVYNANVNLFCIIQLMIELSPTGGVIPSWKFNSVKLLRYVSIFDFFVLGCELMFVVYVIFYISEEIKEMIYFKLEYLKNKWNLFDIIITLISSTCICISIYRTIEVNKKINRLISYTNEYPNFENLGYWETQYNNMVAVLVFFVWIKILKYIRFNKTMNQLALTIRRCAKDILGFSVMFFIVFMAYAQLGHLIFGDQLSSFSDLVNSSLTLLRAILGDFDYDSIVAVDRIVAPIFFLTYIFFVFFILLNVFLAIISDTYSEIKAETESLNVFDMGKFFCRGFRHLFMKLRIIKEKTEGERKKKLTGHKIRKMLINYNFTDLEVDAYLEKYGIEDEERQIDEATAKMMLKDMEGKTNDEILEELTASVSHFSIADFNKLKKRVDAIERSFEDLTPKVNELIHIMEEIFEED